MDLRCRQFPRILRIFAAVLFFFVAVAGLGLSNGSGSGNASPTDPDENVRPLKVKVSPEYPELAKRMNMKGSVRLQLLIAADGHVKKWKVLGGNPVLVQAAEDAVRKWRYAPAPVESTAVVKFDFDPSMGLK
jgi:TonB family protein